MKQHKTICKVVLLIKTNLDMIQVSILNCHSYRRRENETLNNIDTMNKLGNSKRKLFVKKTKFQKKKEIEGESTMC